MAPSGLVRAAIFGSSGYAMRAMRRRLALVAASRRANWRISARPRRYDSDRLAAPVLVGPIGMEAIAAASGLEVDQRRLQIIARRGTSRTRASPLLVHSALADRPRQAARQAEMVAAASRAADRTLAAAGACSPKLSVPTGLKQPAGAVCSAMSQRSDRRPAST